MVYWIALGVALAAPIVLLGAARARRVTTLSWRMRWAFWGIAATAFGLVATRGGAAAAVALIGLRAPTAASFGFVLAAMACLTLATGALSMLQHVLGLGVGDRSTFDEIVRTPVPLRIFVVVTAGIVEEVLYRGVGIGVGRLVLGGGANAALVSTAAFVAAHIRWRAAHLIQVAAAGLILAGTFLVSYHDLWACILAHLVVDAIGFLLMPAILDARRAVTTPGAEKV